jgi:hypothetical protein
MVADERRSNAATAVTTERARATPSDCVPGTASCCFPELDRHVAIGQPAHHAPPVVEVRASRLIDATGTVFPSKH